MADTSDDLSKLARLFLSREDEVGETTTVDDLPQSGDTMPQTTTIEAVIVGHLPVRAGLWLTQYADDVAATDGPTGLVRLDADQFVLELLRAGTESAGASTASTLRQAIETCAPFIARWIIRPESAAGIDQLIDAAPDVITILTGADEIAIVAAYRAIKDIVETSHQLDRQTPAIELAMLGADEHAAEHAAGRIATTAQESLSTNVTLRRTIRSMGPLGSTLHFRFPSDADHELADLMTTIRAGASDDHTREVQKATQTMQPTDASTRRSPDDIAAPIAHETHGTPSASTDEPVRMRPRTAVHVEPKRVIPNPPLKRTTPAPQTLSTWIDGLAILDARCPDAKEIELATDTRGVVHILGWADALREVYAVGAWARKHMELIALATPDHDLDLERTPVLHLFTSEPSNVADLHGSDLRLHLLAPVEVNGQRGWYAAPLND